MEQSSFPKEPIKQPSSEIPSTEIPPWRETAIKLNDTQKITAELTFARTLIEHVQNHVQSEQAKSDLGNRKERKQQKDNDAKRIAGIVGAYQAIASPFLGDLAKFEHETPNASDFISQAVVIIPDLSKKRDNLFQQATTWTSEDEAKEIVKTFTYSESLSKDLQENLQESMGFTTNDLKENLRKWGVSSLGNLVGPRFETMIALANGYLLTNKTSLASYDTKYLLGFLTISYAGWIKYLKDNMNSNYEVLEERGESTKLSSKASYDIAKRITKSKKIHRFAANVGYIAPDSMFEFSSLAAITADKATTQQAMVFLTGANVAAAIYEKIVSKTTDKYLEYKREKLRKKVITAKMEPPERYF